MLRNGVNSAKTAGGKRFRERDMLPNGPVAMRRHDESTDANVLMQKTAQAAAVFSIAIFAALLVVIILFCGLNVTCDQAPLSRFSV